jgi:hypothetical protein
MKKLIPRILMAQILTGCLLDGSALLMAQALPEVGQTGENVGVFGSDTAEPAGTPQPTDTAPPGAAS